MTVYFVQDGGPGGHIKIGYTAGNPHSRIASFRTGNPRPLALLVAIPGGPEDERALHKQFDDLRESGEWFRADARLLGFIEGMQHAYPEQPKDPGPSEEPEFIEEQQFFISGMIYRALVESAAEALLRRHRLGHPLECDSPDLPDVSGFGVHGDDQRWLNDRFHDFDQVCRSLRNVLEGMDSKLTDPSVRRGLNAIGGPVPIAALSNWCEAVRDHLEDLASSLYARRRAAQMTLPASREQFDG